jgi:hypothetical protein
MDFNISTSLSLRAPAYLLFQAKAEGVCSDVSRISRQTNISLHFLSAPRH